MVPLGRSQIDAIKNIEQLDAQLRVPDAPNGKVLQHCKVDVAVARPQHGIASHRSEAALRRVHKRGRIDPLHGLTLDRGAVHAGVRIRHLNAARGIFTGTAGIVAGENGKPVWNCILVVSSQP